MEDLYEGCTEDHQLSRREQWIPKSTEPKCFGYTSMKVMKEDLATQKSNRDRTARKTKLKLVATENESINLERQLDEIEIIEKATKRLEELRREAAARFGQRQ